MMVRSFESIPNEVLLEVFDYFDDIDLLHGFHGLNSRFNSLLYDQHRFRLNFKSISRRTLDMICREHLPLITDRLVALSLSDGKENPEQIDRFFAHIPSFSQLSQLRSLTIFNIRSCQTMLQSTQKCFEFHELTHLKLDSCYCLDNKNNFQEIMNNIWSLPKLIHYDINIMVNPQFSLCTPTIISTSLQSISIFRDPYKWHDLNELFHHTPHLHRLKVWICDNVSSSNQAHFNFHLFSTLRVLNITTASSVDHFQLALLFQNTPNLRHLNIIVWKIIEGQQWEYMIQNYLPKLRIFRLEIIKEYLDHSVLSRRNEYIRELINTFRSPFWIYERQWFVRCFIANSTIYLHTLPSTFQYSYIEPPQSWLTTASYDDQQQVYDSTSSILFDKYFEQPLSPRMQLCYLRNLCIRLPIPTQFRLLVPTLERLDTLSILAHNDRYRYQVQALLNRATHLRSLHIEQESDLPLQQAIFTYTNRSLRRFHIQSCRYYFTQEQCQQLICSPLGSQCHVLSVIVQDRRSIIYLVKKLINLRMLMVRCQKKRRYPRTVFNEYGTVLYPFEPYYDKVIPENQNDVLIPWLRKQLPSTCLVTDDSNDSNRIRIIL